MTPYTKTSKKGIAWFLLCIPLAFILYFAITYTSNNINADDLEKVTVVFPSGTEYTYTDKNSKEYFVNIVLGGEVVSKPSRDISVESPVTVVLHRIGDIKLTNYLYPSVIPSECYLKDFQNNFMLVNVSDAINFISSAECEYLYSGMLLPSLKVMQNNIETLVLPESYEWKYKKANNVFYDDKKTSLFNKSTPVLGVSAGIRCDFIFSLEPSEYNTTFYDKDGKAYSGEIEALIFPYDTPLTAVIEAKWDNSDGAKYYGSGKWSFPILYDIKPLVTLRQTEYKQGDVCVVEFEYLSESEDIKLSTTLCTSDLSMCFIKDKSYALLPIDMSNKAGKYSLSFSGSSGVIADFTITVAPYEGDIGTMNVDPKLLLKLRDPQIGEAEKVAMFESIFMNKENVPLYDGKGVFAPPCADAKTLRKFGSSILINGVPPTVIWSGTDYEVAEKTNVKAAQRGVVVYAGATVEYGNTIVIDHGFGICTHYCSLQSVSRLVGATVQLGEIIAFSGKSGIAETEKLHFAVSINGIFVNPDVFYSSGISYLFT